MKNFSTALFLSILTTSLFAQKELRVGDDVPSIIIEKWIANAPQNKDFRNKAIVLEFWATWCAPCVAAIPKLNNIEDDFKTNPNISFISLTSDKEEVVQSFLKYKTINAMVANDPAMKTARSFRLMFDNAFSIPKMLLIDNRGIVRWIGHPDNITSKMISKFVSKCDFAAYDNELKTSSPAFKIAQEIKNDTLVQRALKLFKDSTTASVCEVIKENSSNTSEMKTHIIGSIEMGFYCEAHTALDSVLSKLMNADVSDIEIPKALQNTKVSIIYKGKHSNSLGETNKVIADQILNALNLKSKSATKSVTDYVLVMKDSTRKINPKLFENPKSISLSPDQFTFSGELKNINRCLQNFFPFNFIDRTDTEGNVKFYLNKKSIQGLIQSFENYGIAVKKENRVVETYKFD